MKKVNSVLKKLISKYKVLKYKGKFKTIYNTDRKVKLLIKELKKEYQGYNWIIVGDSEGLAAINKYQEFKASGYKQIKIYDDRGHYIKNWKIDDNKNTVILLSTKCGRHYSATIKIWSAIKDYKNIKIIDIYDYFYINNCNVYYDYWMYSPDKREVNYKKSVLMVLRHYFRNLKIFNDYGGYYERLNYSKIAKDIIEKNETKGKKKVYERLISTYLEIRDFLNMFIIIDEYISKGYDVDSRYKGFKNDVKILLDKIEKAVYQRKEQDIVLNWVDEISFEYMKQMKFLSKIWTNSTSFDNSYTVMPWTTWTLKTMFSGNYVIDDKMFLFPKIDDKSKKYSLMEYFYSKGIKFIYIGPETIANKTFSRKYIGKRYIKAKNRDEISYISTMGQWNGICNLLNTNKRSFIIIHNIYETHSPYFFINQDSWDRDDFYDTPDKKLKGAKYIDSQLEFYNQFYKNSIQIYMSDHGEHVDIENKKFYPIYSQELINTFFFINNQKEKNKGVHYKDKIFSLVHFKNLVKLIIENGNLEDCLRNEGSFQIYDTYSKISVEDMIRDLKNKETWMQNRGIVTPYDKYVIFCDGEKRYFLLDNENENLINEEAYQERIKFLKEKCTDNFIDIYNYDFFRYSRKLYGDRRKG